MIYFPIYGIMIFIKKIESKNMIDQLITNLEFLDDSLWEFIGLPGIMLLGLYLSIKSNFIQIRQFPRVLLTFFRFMKPEDKKIKGVHPLKAFFACVGGCTGIGNVVAICTAIQIGGPGALFWIWITAIAGSILKYAEVYLGVRYRVRNNKGGYSGGPMYYLQQVSKQSWLPGLAALLLCVYGVEIYQFTVITNTITTNFTVFRPAVVVVLLILVMGASVGGVRRVGQISSWLIPIFIVLYVGMGSWVLIQNIELIPGIFKVIFKSAFTGHAAVGAFAGSSLLLTISQGIRRGCYAGDIGVGYASVLHSETTETRAEKQASLAIIDIFIDSFVVCTTSVMLVLLTDVWKEPMDASLLIQNALGRYFPMMEFFMPFFLFLLGYTTIIAYFCAGIKCAEYLSPKYGKRFYYAYSTLALFFFSFVDTTQALMIMSITGALLLLINLYAICHLRHEIPSHIPSSAGSTPTPVPVCDVLN